MYNRRIYTFRMKRSSSRRTYKKRRTFRKSRSNRHRKTQRGGFGFGGQFKSMGLGNMNFVSPEQSHSPSINPINTSMFGKIGNSSTFGKGIVGTGALVLGAYAAKKVHDSYKNRQTQSAPAQVPGLSVVGKPISLQPKDLSKRPFKRTGKRHF